MRQIKITVFYIKSIRWSLSPCLLHFSLISGMGIDPLYIEHAIVLPILLQGLIIWYCVQYDFSLFDFSLKVPSLSLSLYLSLCVSLSLSLSSFNCHFLHERWTAEWNLIGYLLLSPWRFRLCLCLCICLCVFLCHCHPLIVTSSMRDGWSGEIW